MAAQIISGNLLEATEDAIVQQCNCVTSKPHGLSSSIFKQWPEANVYAKRSKRSTPGTIDIRECNDKIIVNLFGQYYPSISKYGNDSVELRFKWFCQGLRSIGNKLIETGKITSIAFPFRIGCGLAGGNWSKYKKAIDIFAEQYSDVSVVIYKLP